MSFQSDKKKVLEWKNWSQQHQAELFACGIPFVVLEDRKHWLYFLDHGYFTPPGVAEPIVNVDQMEQGDAERLCSFLENNNRYQNSDALNRLQYLLKRGVRSKT